MGDRVVADPLVLGHESAGHVAEVDQDVASVDVGDVAIEPGVPCGHRDYCRSGRYNLCQDAAFMSTPGTDGRSESTPGQRSSSISARRVGLAPDGTVPVDTSEIVRRQIDVRGSYRFANTYPAALSLLEAGEIDLTKTIDVERPLERIGDAFERAVSPTVLEGLITTE